MVGRTARQAETGAREAWRCRPGSTCAREKAQEKAYAQYGISLRKGASREEREAAHKNYSEAVSTRAAQELQIAKAQQQMAQARQIQYEQSTHGRLLAGAAGVVTSAGNVADRGALGAVKDMRGRKYREPIAKVPRAKRSPKYAPAPVSRSSPMVWDDPFRNDMLGNMEIRRKTHVRSVDDEFSRLM